MDKQERLAEIRERIDRDGEDWVLRRARTRLEAPWWFQFAIMGVCLGVAGFLMWVET